MNKNETVELIFPTAGPADAERLAEDLARAIRQEFPDVNVEQVRASPDHMAVGSIIAILVGSAAVRTLAKGIADWLRRQADPDLVVKRGSTQITVKSGLSSEQKTEIILKALDPKA